MPSSTSGIIDFALHPPLGLMSPFLDYYGPYSGVVTVTQMSETPGPIFTNRLVKDTFGVLIQLNGPIPSGWGFTNGWVSEDAQYDEAQYENRLCQLVVQHQFLSGSWVTTQMLDLYSFPRVVLWQEALPGRIGLDVAPGLSFDLFFLLLGVP